MNEEYIKMCEKATEIQNKWKPQEWDYIYAKRYDYDDDNEPAKILVISGYCTDSGYYGVSIENGKLEGIDGDATWLPRQDQLQEMVMDCDDPLCVLIPFYRFVRDLPCPAPIYSDTFEQLWLAFVMKELFSKVWHNGRWR